MVKRYSINPTDCYASLSDFYNKVAELLGVKVSEGTRYDCRKICITKAVMDQLWQFYFDEGYAETTIAQIFLVYGPKANLDNEKLEFSFLVEDGFVVEER